MSYPQAHGNTKQAPDNLSGLALACFGDGAHAGQDCLVQIANAAVCAEPEPQQARPQFMALAHFRCGGDSRRPVQGVQSSLEVVDVSGQLEPLTEALHQFEMRSDDVRVDPCWTVWSFPGEFRGKHVDCTAQFGGVHLGDRTQTDILGPPGHVANPVPVMARCECDDLGSDPDKFFELGDRPVMRTFSQ